MTVDGHQLTAKGALFPERVSIHRELAHGNSFPEDHDMTSIHCLGLQLMILSPPGVFPAAGRYQVVGGLLSDGPGIVNMNVYYDRVGAGLWPFALTGVHLEAKNGVLQLDELTTTTARGTFRAIMRRQPNGE